MSIRIPHTALATAAAACLLAAVPFAPAHAAAAASFSQLTGHVSSFVSAVPQPVAADLSIDLAGINSIGGLGTPGNTLLTLTAQSGALVDLLSFSLTLSTFGASWLSEASVLITNSAGDGVFFNPGAGDDFSGTRSYAADGSLASLGIAFNVLADGKLFVEFYEDFDDNPGAPDATYLAGTLTLAGIAAAVPEPASYGLMALGLIGVVGLARRRRRSGA